MKTYLRLLSSLILFLLLFLIAFDVFSVFAVVMLYNLRRVFAYERWMFGTRTL